MGKQKYLAEIENLFNKSAVVTMDSIARLVRSKKRVKQYDEKLVRNLVLKGKIKRLAKSFYTKHDDPSLAVFCFSPAYLGLQDALSFHNLWEQETIPVVITSKKVRQGMRKVIGANVLVRRLDKKYLFGFEYSKQNEFYLPYSDIEKTFIDMIYFREQISNEALRNIRKRADRKKLSKYLKAYPKKFRERVFVIYDGKNIFTTK